MPLVNRRRPAKLAWPPPICEGARQCQDSNSGNERYQSRHPTNLATWCDFKHFCMISKLLCIPMPWLDSGHCEESSRCPSSYATRHGITHSNRLISGGLLYAISTIAAQSKMSREAVTLWSIQRSTDARTWNSSYLRLQARHDTNKATRHGHSDHRHQARRILKCRLSYISSNACGGGGCQREFLWYRSGLWGVKPEFCSRPNPCNRNMLQAVVADLRSNLPKFQNILWDRRNGARGIDYRILKDLPQERKKRRSAVTVPRLDHRVWNVSIVYGNSWTGLQAETDPQNTPPCNGAWCSDPRRTLTPYSDKRRMGFDREWYPYVLSSNIAISKGCGSWSIWLDGRWLGSLPPSVQQSADKQNYRREHHTQPRGPEEDPTHPQCLLRPNRAQVKLHAPAANPLVVLSAFLCALACEGEEPAPTQREGKPKWNTECLQRQNPASFTLIFV